MGVLQDLGMKGLPLPEDLIRDLQELDTEAPATSPYRTDTEGPFYDGRRHLWLYDTPPPVEGNEDIVNDPYYYDRIPQAWKDEWPDSRPITVADYTPKGCPEELPREFYHFLMSSWERFDKLEAYKPFWLYCEQARRMNADPTSAEDFARYSQEWIDYCVHDVERERDNHLYALDRYVSIKDDTQPGGRRRYRASAPQALLCYLKNIGLSYILMKGRQAAITSTEMALAQIRMRVIKSYKGVLVTDDLEVTGKNIFEDKFWSTSQHMPWWQQPKKVPHKSSLRVMFDFDAGKGKAESKRSTAEFSVLSSKDTQTINGTTPTDLYGDEGQNISTLEKILDERRPTQLAVVDGMMRVVRQTFLWGTGASSDKGKGALEDAYKNVKEQMIDGRNTQGWVVLFFDAFCRPYMNKKIYFDEYWKYIGSEKKETKGRSLEDKKSMFCSHYPMRDEDSFMRTDGSMVPYIWVKGHQDRIATHYPTGPTKGRFVAAYDKSQKMPKGLHQEFYIDRNGIRFVPAEITDLSAPVSMFKDREDGWIDNYIQATDPIQSETGQSLMASTIMAAAARSYEKDGILYHVPAPICIVNTRTPKTKDTFLQTKLMGMYYANVGERACPELVEYNQGHNYLEYVQSPFVDAEMSLMLRAELGPGYSIGNHTFGIDMKEEVKSRLHLDLQELNSSLANNIWYREYFSQLKNIEQEEVGRKIKWYTKDVRRYNDDLVMSMVLAYVAMKTRYAGKQPRRIGTSAAPTSEVRMVKERMPDGTVIWVERRVNIEYEHAA